MKNLRLESNQRGAVTLIITLLVLIAITIGSFAMVQTSTFESRMTANDQRSREALQAAQAGIDYVLSHLSSDPVDAASLCSTTTLDSYSFQLSFEGPFAADGLSFDPSTHAASCLATPFNVLTTLSVWSRGYSNDRESERTIVSTVELTAPWNFLYSRLTRDPLAPPAGANPAIKALGSVLMNGTPIAGKCEKEASSDINCGALLGGGKAKEGTYSLAGTLVQAGGDIVPGEASPMTSENYDANSSALRNEDGTLFTKDQFFESVFGASRDEFLYTTDSGGNKIPKYTPVDGGKGGPSGSSYPAGLSGIVYVDGDFSLGGGDKMGDYGADSPVILIVTGKMSFSGNAEFYGTVYAGEVAFANPSGKGAAGTPTIVGSLNSETNVPLSGVPQIYTPGDTQGGAVVDLPTQAELDQIIAEYGSLRQAAVRVGSWREVRN